MNVVRMTGTECLRSLASSLSDRSSLRYGAPKKCIYPLVTTHKQLSHPYGNPAGLQSCQSGQLIYTDNLSDVAATAVCNLPFLIVSQAVESFLLFAIKSVCVCKKEQAKTRDFHSLHF